MVVFGLDGFFMSAGRPLQPGAYRGNDGQVVVVYFFFLVRINPVFDKTGTDLAGFELIII